VPGRVTTRRQFARLASPTSKGHSGPLRIAFASWEEGPAQVAVAFAISRKVGSAVVRNRIRRRLRDLVDRLEPAPRSGLYLIKCGIETGDLSYDQLNVHLQRALERADCR
jgi:ribonuclease P protein component